VHGLLSAAMSTAARLEFNRHIVGSIEVVAEYH
jgi:hypothetical protein